MTWAAGQPRCQLPRSAGDPETWEEEGLVFGKVCQGLCDPGQVRPAAGTTARAEANPEAATS
jgi:hypothetical protein